MKVGSWKRTLLAGALGLAAFCPVATYAAPIDTLDTLGPGQPVSQFGFGFGGGGGGACSALGGGSVIGPGVAFGSFTQTASEPAAVEAASKSGPSGVGGPHASDSICPSSGCTPTVWSCSRGFQRWTMPSR